MIEITSGVDVAVPAEVAWAVIADFARNPEWQSGMESCRWLTDPPIAIGSRYEQQARFLGRTISTTFEVVGLDGGVDRSSVTIDSIVSTFPLTITRSVRSTPTGCRIDAVVAGRPDGLMGLLGPLLARLVKRSVDGDYRRLRALLET